MGRVVIAKKAVVWRLDDILHRFPEIGSYMEYSKLRKEVAKLRADICEDGPTMKPFVGECEKSEK